MAQAKGLSSGFTTESTRQISDLEREIEYRLGHISLEEALDPDHKKKKKELVAAGNAKDQDDDIDAWVQKYESQVKSPDDQFPASGVLDKLAAGVDEALWEKAKRASQDAFGKIKWPFVTYFYYENGGK